MTSHDASTSYSSSSRGHTADAHEQTARWIRELAAIERPSASPGERDAAQWIVRRLARAGFHARVEAERAHGTHLPFVLPSVATLLAGLLRSRRLAATVALAAVAAIADELEGRKRVMRRALAGRQTYNVVCEIGEARCERTLVFVAHHDAARHGGPARDSGRCGHLAAAIDTCPAALHWLGGDDARGDARLPREAPRRVRPRPPHYHRPSDVPENVNVDSVLGARRLCVAMIDELEPAAESRDSRPAY